MNYREAKKSIKRLAATVGSSRFGLMHAVMHSRGKVVISKRAFIEGVGTVQTESWGETVHEMGAKALCKEVTKQLLMIEEADMEKVEPDPHEVIAAKHEKLLQTGMKCGLKVPKAI
jgi:hypothetical protein